MSRIKCRPLRKEHMPQIIEQLQLYNKEADFIGVVPNKIDIEHRWIRYINRKEFLVVGAFLKDKLVGIIQALCMPYFCDNTVDVNYELVWHSDPRLSSYRRMKIMHKLLDVYQSWASSNYSVGSVFNVNLGSGPYKLLKKKGYRPYQVSMVQVIN